MPGNVFDPPDEELVARVIATNDQRAFETLVRRHQSQVRAFARTVCLDAATADDVAQDAFIRAYKSLAGYRVESRFATWLLAITYNEARQTLRRRARFKRLRSALLAQPKLQSLEAPQLGSPAVHRALATLAPDERSVIVLSHMHDMSHSQIAQVTGLALGTVKSHAARGKTKMRAAIDSQEAHNG